jgi:agmatinase
LRNLAAGKEGLASKMILVNTPAINGLGKTKGCENAYKHILDNLEDIYMNESGKKAEFNKAEIKIDKLDAEAANSTISKKANEFFKKDFSLFIGGDHSISYPLFKSFSKFYKNACLIIFDAHADCMHNIKPPTHEDWLRVLIEEGLDARNIILIGFRNIHPIEKDFLIKNKINLFPCRQLFNNLEEECDAIKDIAGKFENIYLSIDIDVLDAAFAPATGYSESAGLTPRELIYILQRIKMLNVRAADISEVNPGRDKGVITSKAAAKIISELL